MGTADIGQGGPTADPQPETPSPCQREEKPMVRRQQCGAEPEMLRRRRKSTRLSTRLSSVARPPRRVQPRWHTPAPFQAAIQAAAILQTEVRAGSPTCGTGFIEQRPRVAGLQKAPNQPTR